MLRVFLFYLSLLTIMDFSFFIPGIEVNLFLFLGIWGGIIVCFFFLVLLKRGMKYFLSKIAKQHTLRRSFFELFSKISRYSCFSIPLFFGSLFLPFSKEMRIFFAILFAFALMLELGRVMKFLLNVVMEKGFKHQDAKTKKNLTEILNTILQILVWVIATLVFFDTIGIAITPFLASLWVWGIAVAFASQKLIEDFFSSFSIMGSSPFRIGDIITIHGFSWTVKKIWLRTTTLQTVEWKSIIVPNRLVVAEVIENSGTIKTRRKRFSLTVTYETPLSKVRLIPELLKEIISKHKEIDFEWAILKDLQASNLEILVSYLVKSDDWLIAVQLHDKILLEILEVFAKEGIEFAYPTQTLYLKK